MAGKRKTNEQKQNAQSIGQRQGKDGVKQSKAKKSDAATKAKKKGSRETAAVRAKNRRIAKWEETENLILLEGWARDGLSMEQIAKNMGISKPTLYTWQEQSSDIFNALKKGKEVSDYMVENALFASAISGNVVAQIFWLKNRKSEAWQDKIEQKINAEVENTGGIAYLAPRLEVQDG